MNPAGLLTFACAPLWDGAPNASIRVSGGGCATLREGDRR